MKDCACTLTHHPRRVVLTGGPGAGKTAVLEMVRQSLCKHVLVLPEAAGVVFGGGFPRRSDPGGRRAAQRAIFFVQRELEATAESADAAIILCDRGTVDGAAYWPGPGDVWSSVGTTLDAELARYSAVIHLRSPASSGGYNQENPLRVESAVEAAVIDGRIAELWTAHPRRFLVEPTPDFLTKAGRVIELLRAEMPECCRGHLKGPLATPAAFP